MGTSYSPTSRTSVFDEKIQTALCQVQLRNGVTPISLKEAVNLSEPVFRAIRSDTDTQRFCTFLQKPEFGGIQDGLLAHFGLGIAATKKQLARHPVTVA